MKKCRFDLHRITSYAYYSYDQNLFLLSLLTLKSLRKISVEDKRNLGTALSKLCPEDLRKALEIVARNNPNFKLDDEEVNIDMDAQVLVELVLSLEICIAYFLHHLFLKRRVNQHYGG